MLTQNYAIRQFAPSDLGAVIEINRSCLPENYAPSFFLDNFRSCPQGFLVAETSEGIVGYVMCRIEHGFSEFKRFRLARKGHIVSLAVIPSHRHAGIGSALVANAIIALAQYGADECYLEVRVTNHPAILLYRKLGFEITRRVASYYFDGADAFIMSKSLTSD
jgi:ribosomal-protein-alanine N-acetyltransferase